MNHEERCLWRTRNHTREKHCGESLLADHHRRGKGKANGSNQKSIHKPCLSKRTNQRKSLKALRCLLAAVGCALIYVGAGTSDYYTLGLGQPDPAYVWKTMVVGAILMLPALIHCIRTGGAL